ncbi:hypothetical protein ACOMHN_063010 [Nucella lapillus]
MTITDFFLRIFGRRREFDDVEYRNDGYAWDYEETRPLFGDSFPIFPDSYQHRFEDEEDRGGCHKIQPGRMRNALDLDSGSVSEPLVEKMATPRLSFCRRSGWGLSVKSRRTVTLAMLLTAVFTFLPMLTLPLGEGQLAWPISDALPCYDHNPQMEDILHIYMPIARVALFLMAMGVLGALVLNALLLLDLRRSEMLSAQAIICFGTAAIYVVYVAVLPYHCASTASTAALSFCFTFIQLLFLILVPFIQKKDTEEEEEEEEEEDDDDDDEQTFRREEVIRKTSSSAVEEEEKEVTLNESTRLLQNPFANVYIF